MRRIVLLLLMFMLEVSSIFSEEKFLKRENYYPKEDDDYFFKPISDVAITGNNLYAIVNFEHKILKFTINGELKFEKIIGKPGEGPGDLILPITFSIWNGEIAVKDHNGFSFFSLEGNFLQKFRVFTSKWSFVYVNNKLYYVNSEPERKHLIEVYTKDGTKLFEFGNKFKNLNFSLFKGLGSFHVEKEVYGGKILSEGTYIYYLNSKFGKIIKFKLDGTKVEETDIAIFFGKKGEKILKKNEEMWIREGVKLDPKTHGYMPYDLFRDAYLCKDKIYLLGSNWTPGEKDSDEHINIKVLDINSLKLLESYTIRKGKDEVVLEFAVVEKQGIPIFYIGMRAEEGDIIAVYSYER